MNEQISIKVNIADRLFQVKVKSEDEEHIRKAVNLINDKVKTYTDAYGIKDKQAALSMCALELTSELLNSDTRKIQELNLVDNGLTEIIQMFDLK